MICLFSGGLDSFIGAIDLLPLATSNVVSHYWDGITSTHQTYCADVLKSTSAVRPFTISGRGSAFPTDTVEAPGRRHAKGSLISILLARGYGGRRDGGEMVVQVPENALISAQRAPRPSPAWCSQYPYDPPILHGAVWGVC